MALQVNTLTLQPKGRCFCLGCRHRNTLVFICDVASRRAGGGSWGRRRGGGTSCKTCCHSHVTGVFYTWQGSLMHGSALLLLTVAFTRKRHMLLALVRKHPKTAVSKLLNIFCTSKIKNPGHSVIKCEKPCMMQHLILWL